MQNKLRGWLTDNSVTSDPNDQILVLDPAGNVGLTEIYAEMRSEDTGLREETLVHVVTLFQRMVARFLMNGYNVNTGLFYAVPRFTGIVEKGLWNPLKNGIYVSFIQDKVLREEIAKTEVVIKGEKPGMMYVLETEDRSNGLTDGSMTPGRNFAIRGSYLRVLGNDPSVGITLRNMTTDSITKIESDMFGINDPSKIMFVVPANLANGSYELTITTQYMKGKTGVRKTPNSVSIPVFVGQQGGGRNGDRRARQKFRACAHDRRIRNGNFGGKRVYSSRMHRVRRRGRAFRDGKNYGPRRLRRSGGRGKRVLRRLGRLIFRSFRRGALGRRGVA